MAERLLDLAGLRVALIFAAVLHAHGEVSPVPQPRLAAAFTSRSYSCGS